MSRRRATLMIVLVVLLALVCAWALNGLCREGSPGGSPTSTRPARPVAAPVS